MAKIIIIGAGLTGLSTAYHLETHGFYDYKLFEKEAQIGGLCKSVYQDGFTFDYTGHLLHINNDYFKNFLHATAGFEYLHSLSRKSFIYSHKTYTPYPYQTNLYGLPKDVIFDCITGFIEKNNKSKLTKKNVNSNNCLYYNWVLRYFGTGFAKHFFFPYQQKIFDYNVRKLSSSWTSRFVPKTSLKQIIYGSIQQNKETIGYNKQFFYPKTGGIYFWIKKLATQIKNPIYTNICAKKIDLKEKVVILENNKNNSNQYIEPFDILINTTPLDILLQNLKEPTNLSLSPQSKKLLCNQVINFNFGLFSSNKYDKHWIYYPEKKYPFYRIGFYHNFSSGMAPKGCGCLYGEVSCFRKSKPYIQNKVAYAIDEAKKILHIDNRDILTQKIMYIPHAYVIYDFWRDKNLSKIHKILNQYNIYSIGRYGEWKYSSMQEAILDGKQIAQKIIKNFKKREKDEPENYKKQTQNRHQSHILDGT